MQQRVYPICMALCALFGPFNSGSYRWQCLQHKQGVPLVATSSNCGVDVRLRCVSLQWQPLFVYAEHIISLKCENRLRGRQHVHDLVMNERLCRMRAAAIGNARE